jgi:ankyrin repeat protein
MAALILLLVLMLAGCSSREVSPLAAAARAGDLEAIRRSAIGSNALDAPSGVNGWTPLLHAIHKNHAGSVRALLDLGANPNAANPRGTTPLMMAASYRQAEIVQLLLDRGADPTLKNSQGQTALDFARSGVADIDNWTLGHPDGGTVQILTAALERH